MYSEGWKGEGGERGEGRGGWEEGRRGEEEEGRDGRGVMYLHDVLYIHHTSTLHDTVQTRPYSRSEHYWSKHSAPLKAAPMYDTHM